MTPPYDAISAMNQGELARLSLGTGGQQVAELVLTSVWPTTTEAAQQPTASAVVTMVLTCPKRQALIAPAFFACPSFLS